jgi:FkbM family methyltransferase
MIDPSKITSSTVLGRVLRLPLFLVPRRAVMRVRSGPNKGARWRAGSSVHGCWIGTYEAAKTRVVLGFVRAGMTAWDVGANAGYYTLLFSTAVGAAGRVVSFEPFPENLLNLLDHVRWNSAHNTAVVGAALGDRTGLIGFRPGPSNSQGQISSETSTLMVPVVEIDRCIADFGLPAPDVVKMDIEGAEGMALAGAGTLLRNRRSTWFISLHGKQACSETEAILRDFGYSLFRLDGRLISERLTKNDDDIVATTRNGLGGAT